MTHRDRVRFCSLCGARLVVRDEHGIPRRTCPACGHIHYRNPVPAAGVLLAEDGRVLLVKRRYEPRAGAWCLPAGFMEYGETPRRCAVRELREETGLAGRLAGLFGVYAGFDDPRVRAILVLYVARRTGGTLVPGDDAIAARFFRLDRLPAEIAFAAHRQALREFAAHIGLPVVVPRGVHRAVVRAAAPRRPAATPPRRAPGARPRSRRA